MIYFPNSELEIVKDNKEQEEWRGQTAMSGPVIIDILDIDNDERDPLCDEEMSSSDEQGKVLDEVTDVTENTTSPNSCYQSQHSQRLKRKSPVLPLFHGKDPLDQTSSEGKFSWKDCVSAPWPSVSDVTSEG